MRYHLSLSTALLILCLIILDNSWADNLHYNNVLIGGRAMGMGGAYKAVSDDPSGSYYNPAGIALAFEKNLSGSVNTYAITETTYKDVFGGNSDWTRTSESYSGNFVGYLSTLGWGRLGFSIVVPNADEEIQDTSISGFAVYDPEGKTNVNVDTYKLNINLNDKTLLAGPSYGFEINERISIGITLYGHYRSSELAQNEIIFFNNNEYEVDNTQISMREYGVHPIIGVLLSPVEKFSIGLTYAKKEIFFSSTNSQLFIKQYNTETNLWDSNGCTTENFDIRKAQCYSKIEDSARRKTPHEFGLGLAYFPSNRLLVSADFTYYTKPDDNQISTNNLALGIEYYLTNQMVFRGGIFTNNANTPEVSSTKSDQETHVDLLGGSLSIAHMGRTTALSFGGFYSQGKGKGQAISGSSQVQDVVMRSYALFMSGEVHL